MKITIFHVILFSVIIVLSFALVELYQYAHCIRDCASCDIQVDICDQEICKGYNIFHFNQ